jgi:BirA family biotin operon repressor/biotin-[acetyl-CoA-carboxylase] ligase
MNELEFNQAVAGLPFEKAEFFATVGSTNDILAEWARQGLNGLAIAAADEQTRGRGRAGRTWFTPPGSALAFSVLLNVQATVDHSLLARTSGLGALAVCEALEQLSLEPQIKWPNDVLLKGKKVCGILPEAHWNGEHLQALILGIGINVAPASVPPETTLTFPAGSVEDELGKRVSTQRLLRAILESLLAWYPRLSSKEFIQAWDRRLAYKERLVRLEVGDGTAHEATLVGLGPDGSLKLKLPGGETRGFQMGEIQIRPAD